MHLLLVQLNNTTISLNTLVFCSFVQMLIMCRIWFMQDAAALGCRMWSCRHCTDTVGMERSNEHSW